MEEARIALFSGRAHPEMAAAIAAELGIRPGKCILGNFPDDELQVEILEVVEGRDVCIVQPTSPPAASHFLELMLMADACKRAGALRVIAVVPYFGYARQDRRVRAREPIGARLVAELMESRIDRLVTIDLHTPAVEGFFKIPVDHFSAVPLLAEALRQDVSSSSVLVSPDLGAAKIVKHYAQILGLPIVYAQKARLNTGRVSVQEVVGEVEGRRPILVDDMVSTGATLVSVMQALLDRGCRTPFTVAATHGLFVGPAKQHLASFPLSRIILTDSIAPKELGSLPVHTVSLKKPLAGAIRKLIFTPES